MHVSNKRWVSVHGLVLSHREMKGSRTREILKLRIVFMNMEKKKEKFASLKVALTLIDADPFQRETTNSSTFGRLVPIRRTILGIGGLQRFSDFFNFFRESFSSPKLGDCCV